MDKVKKIALISLIWLLAIFFISVFQTSPIHISVDTGAFLDLPLINWVVLLVSPFLLYLIAKDNKNPLVPLGCVVFYFFIFYSSGLYFFSHPTISDVASSGRYQEILVSIDRVSPKEFNSEIYISAARYFRWPVYFIFSKIFTTILGIGPILTLNLGFFCLLLILPFPLTMYFKRKKRVDITNIYFIFPALYLTLAWHFINDQFVPQFMALLYLIILFGCYLKYRNNGHPAFLLFMVIFYALTVFTHPFMFLFFLITIISEVFWSEYVEMERARFISYGLIITFFAMLFPYYGDYYSLARHATGGQSWRVFQQFFSQRSPGGNGFQTIKLYGLVPKIFDQIMSNISRVVIAGIFVIVAIGLLYYILKKRKFFDFDISVLIGSAAWFALGLANLVLGQRALQVGALPLARNIKRSRKIFSFLPKIAIILILIAPTIFVANSMINSSISGDRMIQDPVETIAGRFMDEYITNESVISTAQNFYPTAYPTGFRTFAETRGWRWELVDFVLDSPKSKKNLMVLNTNYPSSYFDSVVYDNNEIKLINLQFDEE